MPVLPPGVGAGAIPAPPAPVTFRTICTNALYELNVSAPGEVPDPLDLAFALDKANQLADSWSTQQYYIYASQLVSQRPDNNANYLLTPGLSPHTIGPTPGNPSFLIAFERPVRIVSANILLSNVNPIVRFPVAIRDKDWWAKQRVQTIQTALPTDLYYRPDWPLGSLFFWPVPNFAYRVEFEIESIIQGGISLDTPYVVPPGYELAFTLTLAELLCPAFEKQLNPLLGAAASKARLNVIALNAVPPRINLDDFGPPSSERARATFNYRTGLDR